MHCNSSLHVSLESTYQSCAISTDVDSEGIKGKGHWLAWRSLAAGPWWLHIMATALLTRLCQELHIALTPRELHATELGLDNLPFQGQP